MVAANGLRDQLVGVGGIVGTEPISSTVWTSRTATRTAGVFQVELWAADEPVLQSVLDAVLSVVGDTAAAAAAGFSVLSTSSVGAMDLAPLGVVTAGIPPAATALREVLECAFSFESVVPQQTGPDGLIKKVRVEIDAGIGEVMDI